MKNTRNENNDKWKRMESRTHTHTSEQRDKTRPSHNSYRFCTGADSAALKLIRSLYLCCSSSNRFIETRWDEYISIRSIQREKEEKLEHIQWVSAVCIFYKNIEMIKLNRLNVIFLLNTKFWRACTSTSMPFKNFQRSHNMHGVLISFSCLLLLFLCHLSATLFPFNYLL